MSMAWRVPIKTKQTLVSGESHGVKYDAVWQISIQCLSCAHYQPDLGIACTAFPDGIPLEIVQGKHNHEQPFSGDKDIRYQPES